MSENESTSTREDVPELNKILGQRFPVLDDGYVRVIDYMGSDAAIVQAARVSYGRGTKKLSEDAALIRYLMRHAHTTPFEMCEIKLHVRVPMDCWRQWIRHRTASVNEYSTRYSLAIDAAQRTQGNEWRLQAPSNKQGSEGVASAEIGAELTRQELELQEFSRKIYLNRVSKGVAREQARKDLPLSTYTEAYWKIDLHNLLHFLSLRTDEHAQQEIRQYANIISNEIVKRWCPIAWEAFVDYRQNAIQLSSREIQILHAIAEGNASGARTRAVDFGWLSPSAQSVRNREREEFERKLSRLGFAPPWA